MKKILLTAAALAGISAIAHAQVGVNTEQPKTSLDITGKPADASSADGILVPRISRALLTAKTGYADGIAGTASAQNGALVFVDVLDGTASGKTVNVTVTGFYFYDGTVGNNVWKAVGGASGTDTSIYNSNGTLTGAREVTQADNNLTFTTGTARTIINGTFETQGAVYMKTRAVFGDLTATTWAANDYHIVLSGTSNNISLPDATTNAGRVISLTNQTGGNRTFVTGAQYKPQNIASITGGKGMLLISDGNQWQLLAGYL